MPEVFILESAENPSNQQTIRFEKDRYTPPVSDEIDQQPFRSSSQTRPELYHLNGPSNDEPQPMAIPFDQPQSYSPVNPSPTFPGNNRVSPLPRSNLKKQGPEMYHLVSKDDPRQQSPPIKSTRFNDQTTRYEIDHDSSDQPGKVTVFTISANHDENNRLPPPASPPIRPMKNKQQPFAYDIVNDENKYPPAPPPPMMMASNSNPKRAFPTGLHEVSSNIRYVPLDQSKASESIARSMNKYRFAAY